MLCNRNYNAYNHSNFHTLTVRKEEIHILCVPHDWLITHLDFVKFTDCFLIKFDFLHSLVSQSDRWVGHRKQLREKVISYQIFGANL